MKYHADVTRGDRYWLVHVREIDQWTQAKSIRAARDMAVDLIAIFLDVDPKSFDLEISATVPPAAAAAWDRSIKLKADAAALQAESALAARDAAKQLAADGTTLRDIGELLGISYQRAHQLVS